MSVLHKLGFGLMRLPEKSDGEIDRIKVCEMVDRFLAEGFTYFDTAYYYHNGRSEGIVKAALAERYPRERFTVADKMVHYALKTPEDNAKVFAEQLERTGLEYFDFYLLHGISGRNWRRYQEIGCWDYAKRMLDEGRIRNLGFSFHGTPELLDQLLTEHPEAAFVQLQLNYLDWDSPIIQARRCYEQARAHHRAVTVMEPVKGGMLANLPQSAAAALDALHPDASHASWALRFCAGLEGVTTVLSGMSSLEQVADNARVMKTPLPLDTSEKRALEKALAVLSAVPTVPCTDCRYCVKGCPAGLGIPALIKTLNQYRVFGLSEPVRRLFSEIDDKGPEDCLRCGQCEDVCPQHLNVMALMRELDAVLHVD